ncbi:MAG TPA: tetratricopeptide repeat protein, partial [Bacteroidota bacterium]
MKRSLTLVTLALWALVQGSWSQTGDAEAAKNWSLFFEYHKNGDFTTAAPYGWKVINLAPKRFKTVYSKLAECYYNFYQQAAEDARTPYADTMIAIYDMGIKNIPERTAGLWLSRGYALATYFQDRDLEAIESYEKALQEDPKTEFAYFDQLGLLYIKHMEEHPEFRTKAITMYRAQKERFPDNPVITERLKVLISDPHELVKIAEQDLTNDPENLEKIWNAAQANTEAEEYERAETLLQSLVKRSPTTATYWNELAKVRQRSGKYRQAITSYEEALKLNPALKENYLNITVCYRMMKNYTAARSTALRAAQKDRGWGRPYVEIAEVYKSAVENCIKDTKDGDWSKMDIDDKLMYRL